MCVLFQNSTSMTKCSDWNSHPYIVRFYDGDESIYSCGIPHAVVEEISDYTIAS